MEVLEHLALAALLQALPDLLAATGTPVTPATRRVLNLTRLDCAPALTPALTTLLTQARQYASSLAQDQPLMPGQARRTPGCRPHYQQLAPLPATRSALEVLFPRPAPDTAGLTEHLRHLAAELDWMGTAVDLTRFDRCYPHLLVLLERFGWCLAGHNADVSLYDEARLTSAIAVCLYQYHAEQLTATALAAGTESERFCLLVGKLVGIPQYLFACGHNGRDDLAQRLGARSLYLTLLADGISHQVARRFGVPFGNSMLAIGDTFYLLLPNRAHGAAIVQELRREFEHWLQQTFNGEITLSLAQISFSGEQFQAGSATRPGFGGLLHALEQRLKREQQRPAHALLTQAGEWDEAAFLLRHDFTSHGICEYCGKFPALPPDNQCTQCSQDQLWGQRLLQMRYIAYYQEHAGADARPLPAGGAVRLLGAHQLAQAGTPYLLVKLNDPHLRGLADYPGAFRYLARHFPTGRYAEPLTFGELAAQAQGQPLLGYISASLDHREHLYAQELRPDTGRYASAAQIITLNGDLERFWAGWVSHRLSQPPADPEPDYRNFYLIGSGGGDLCLIGPWDRAAALACDLHTQLSHFTGNNDDITISAGLFFTKTSYPVAHAARAAIAALEQSRTPAWADPQENIHTGNRVTILGDTLTWKSAQALLAQIAALQPVAADLTPALLHNLVEYGRLYRLGTDEALIEGLRYKARFAYSLVRTLRKGNPALYRWADALLQSLHTRTPNPTLEHLGLIATYLLCTRPERSQP